MTGEIHTRVDIPAVAKRGVVVKIPNRKERYAFASVDGEEVFIKPQLALKCWLREGQVVYIEVKHHERGLRAQKVYKTDETVGIDELRALRLTLKKSA